MDGSRPTALSAHVCLAFVYGSKGEGEILDLLLDLVLETDEEGGWRIISLSYGLFFFKIDVVFAATDGLKAELSVLLKSTFTDSCRRRCSMSDKEEKCSKTTDPQKKN